MDRPLQHQAERGPVQSARSLRLTKVAGLRQEIEALEAQKNAKEQEYRMVMDRDEIAAPLNFG